MLGKLCPTRVHPCRDVRRPSSFADSGVEVTDDGRPLLEQAEAAGLTPESGCRMGICHSCTRRKTSGVVKNLTTGVMSSTEAEDVQICVSVPVGDVDLALCNRKEPERNMTVTTLPRQKPISKTVAARPSR